MWLKLVEMFVGVLVKLGMSKRAEADKQRADAAEKTLESVPESLEVEKDIRDQQKAVKPEDVKGEDGGLKFDEFNKDSSDEK